MNWLLVVTSLSGQQGALRIRVWRALKAAGAVPLRDGVYLAPAVPSCARVLEEQKAEISGSSGSAYVLPLSHVDPSDEAEFIALFDRSDEYGALQRAAAEFIATLAGRSEPEARRALRQLKRDLAGIEATDFFPGTPREGATESLRLAEAALTRTFSPEEPAPIRAAIATRNASDYRGRTWATRERLWIDRVASAWLIKRFIDPDATFLWLRRPSDCPGDAVGFDFDGAEFTHVDERVTFEVLIESFSHTIDAALTRLGSVVHAIDVGGERVPEALGLEAVLTGARERLTDDDEFLERASLVFDDLYAAFSQPQPQAEA